MWSKDIHNFYINTVILNKVPAIILDLLMKVYINVQSIFLHTLERNNIIYVIYTYI